MRTSDLVRNSICTQTSRASLCPRLTDFAPMEVRRRLYSLSVDAFALTR